MLPKVWLTRLAEFNRTLVHKDNDLTLGLFLVVVAAVLMLVFLP